MNIVRSFLVWLCLSTMAWSDTQTVAPTAAPTVVVSIMPLYHIAQAVMGKLGEPELLLPPGVSEHMYSLKPSQYDSIKNADLVVWIGPELETYLTDVLSDVPEKKQMVLLTDPRVIRYDMRVDGIRSRQTDPHLWLDPLNGMAIAEQLRNRLIKLDPEHEKIYKKNTDLFIDKISTLDNDLTARLKPFQSIPFVAYHDAFQYFEKRYGMRQMDIMSARPDVPMSAARWVDMAALLKSEKIHCIVSEPQNQTGMVKQFAATHHAMLEILDPLGAEEPAGTEGYAALLSNIADGLSACLANIHPLT